MIGCLRQDVLREDPARIAVELEHRDVELQDVRRRDIVRRTLQRPGHRLEIRRQRRRLSPKAWTATAINAAAFLHLLMCNSPVV